MSVNYYWIMDKQAVTIRNPIGDEKVITIDENDPLIHVCQWAAGRYSWAQDPKKVLAECERYPLNVLMRDENGITYTGADFSKMVREARWETNFIGKWFC